MPIDSWKMARLEIQGVAETPLIFVYFPILFLTVKLHQRRLFLLLFGKCNNIQSK